jgi:hypothetical protein
MHHVPPDAGYRKSHFPTLNVGLTPTGFKPGPRDQQSDLLTTQPSTMASVFVLFCVICKDSFFVWQNNQFERKTLPANVISEKLHLQLASG